MINKQKKLLVSISSLKKLRRKR